MRILRFYPDKLYGFATAGKEEEFFFHLSNFRAGDEIHLSNALALSEIDTLALEKTPPPPILGERVLVHGIWSGPSDRAPRASLVERLDVPRLLLGTVDTFDLKKRYGFVTAEGESYHLHESEVVNGRLPNRGSSVLFFAGVREGKPRACHVRVCR